MGASLPIFPLGTVLFPGVTMPLHIFEDRYRSLISTLLEDVAEAERAFGIVAIREGYEVGSRGVHSVQRVGCEARLVVAHALKDGRFDIEVVGGRRLRVDALDPAGEYMVGEVAWLDEANGDGVDQAARGAAAAVARYGAELRQMRGDELFAGKLPRDPTALSYSLASTCLLTLQERQSLLEVDDTANRLRLLTALMRQETRAMQAVPSLPATDVPRTSWSPN